jgi:hypothetical protein
LSLFPDKDDILTKEIESGSGFEYVLREIEKLLEDVK